MDLVEAVSVVVAAAAVAAVSAAAVPRMLRALRRAALDTTRRNSRSHRPVASAGTLDRHVMVRASEAARRQSLLALGALARAPVSALHARLVTREDSGGLMASAETPDPVADSEAPWARARALVQILPLGLEAASVEVASALRKQAGVSEALRLGRANPRRGAIPITPAVSRAMGGLADVGSSRRQVRLALLEVGVLEATTLRLVVPVLERPRGGSGPPARNPAVGMGGIATRLVGIVLRAPEPDCLHQAVYSFFYSSLPTFAFCRSPGILVPKKSFPDICAGGCAG